MTDPFQPLFDYWDAYKENSEAVKAAAKSGFAPDLVFIHNDDDQMDYEAFVDNSSKFAALLETATVEYKTLGQVDLMPKGILWYGTLKMAYTLDNQVYQTWERVTALASPGDGRSLISYVQVSPNASSRLGYAFGTPYQARQTTPHTVPPVSTVVARKSGAAGRASGN